MELYALVNLTVTRAKFIVLMNNETRRNLERRMYAVRKTPQEAASLHGEPAGDGNYCCV